MAKAVRAFKYGLRAPILGAAEIEEALRLSHAYRNKMVELELRRREAMIEMLRRLAPELAAVQDQIAAIDKEVEDVLKEQRRANRRARTSVRRDDLRERLKDLRARLRELRAEEKRLRKEAWERDEVQQAAAVVEEQATKWLKEARAAHRLNSYDKWAIEQNARRLRSGPPPRFQRWIGEGCIVYRLRPKASWSDLLRGDRGAVRIVPEKQDGQRYSKRGVRLPDPSPKRAAERHILWLRITVGEKKATWLAWPMIVHRPIPEEAEIMLVQVVRRMVAGKPRWYVVLLAEADEEVFAHKDIAPSGLVGLDIGFRKLANGDLRVAYWVGDDGAEGELVLPAEKVALFQKVRQLRSVQDRSFNEARDALAQWLEEHQEEAPEWLRERARTVTQWRAPRRLDALVREWGDRRFAGDEAIYNLLVAWRRQDRHLWQWWANLLDQLRAWRLDVYYNFIARLRRRYRTVAIEDMDLRELRGQPSKELDPDGHSNLRDQANWAALHVLRDVLARGGQEIVKVNPANTTQACHACGTVQEFDARRHLVWTCYRCGATWDQDANAARNLLAAAQEAVASAS